MANTGKRLAKSTMYMYIRMVLLMLISLYTSRVILRALGVEDYGIYNVVGSVVVMFASLRGVFASSTHRYLSYELGKGNKDNLVKVFNISLQINTITAILFLLLAESVGLWFVNYKMNVSAERLVAVHYVLQFSICGAVLSVFTTTFDALIIAHEKMSFYANLSIFEGLMKLSICFIIGYADDKLICYGLLIMFTTVFILLINAIYCKKHFQEVHLKFVRDREYFLIMTKFAGWNFFGNTSYTLSQNGLNMLLNVFGGPIVNAARGIAYQVNQVLQQVINNIAIVVKPYIIKTYAQGNEAKIQYITCLSTKIYFIIQLQIVILFTFFLYEIIYFWLGQVPKYSVVFLTLLLWHSLIRSLHGAIDLLFYAVGDLKNYQIAEGILLFLSVPISYLLLYIGCPYYSCFITVIAIEIINFVVIVFIASDKCKLQLKKYFKSVFLPCLLCTLIYAGMFCTFHLNNNNALLVKGSFAVASSLLSLVYMIFKGFNTDERNLILAIFSRKR